jgi:hypothetical protein
VKYFTTEWWSSGCKDETVFAEYEAYLASISDRLPEPLVELETSHTLHDAEVERISNDFVSREVELVMHGWDINLRYPVRYLLKFSGVSHFEQVLPPHERGKRREELGDLGYWEYELVASGVEMRMLFVSSAQFSIVFQGFSFSYERLLT